MKIQIVMPCRHGVGFKPQLQCLHGNLCAGGRGGQHPSQETRHLQPVCLTDAVFNNHLREIKDCLAPENHQEFMQGISKPKDWGGGEKKTGFKIFKSYM